MPSPRIAPPYSAPSRHRLRRLGGLLTLFCAPLLLCAQVLEYRVKAAFVFNFARFVEWPAEALPPGVPLRVGVWAPAASFQIIADALAGKSVAGHQLAVFPFEPGQGALPHILFVHEAREPLSADLVQHLSDHHVLLVGESPGFAARHGVIGLVPRGDSLRFQVNLAAARRTRLNLSGQLARLAETVRDQP